MVSRGWLLVLGVASLLGVSGCPVTDDYYIEASRVSAGGALPDGGTTPAMAGSPSAEGGTAGNVEVPGIAGEQPAAGAPALLSAGGAAGCTVATERCNGHDDDCDDLIDELVCNSSANGTASCSGFVLPSAPTHGYMLCTAAKTYAQAQVACAAQNMRLAWLESAAENSAVSKKVAALSNDVEALIGANDIANEGEWFWDRGAQFWQGNENGAPVDGLFNAWASGTPNNENNDEDCAVLMSATSTWGDRSCAAKYAYLCEEN